MGRKAHPPELRARAVELRALGRSFNSIGRELGVGPNTARAWVDPAFAERYRVKAREAKHARTGICVECGGATKLNKQGDGFSLRCRWCAEGRPRPEPVDGRRRVPVRLCDLRPAVLLEAAWEWNRFEQGELERQEVLLAAVCPSDRVFWVAESARPVLDAALA